MRQKSASFWGSKRKKMPVIDGKRTLVIEVIYCEGNFELSFSDYIEDLVCHELPRVLSFEAEAGHTYIAKGKRVSGVAIVWLEDAETGEVVAEREP